LSEILSEVSDAVALEEAAMAVRLDAVTAVPLTGAQREHEAPDGDVVASAA
jgi:hypothetical protein